VLAVMGALAFFHTVPPRYGGLSAVDPVPLGLALLAAGLLYLALFLGNALAATWPKARGARGAPSRAAARPLSRATSGSL